MAKYLDIARTLEQRIEHGDYRLRGFPAHGELVEEFNANSRTISKALNELLGSGRLERSDTGRVYLPRKSKQSALHLGLVVPAYPSPFVFYWHRIIESMADKRGWTFKLLPYTHWRDTTLSEALNGLSGVFFLPQGDDIPTDVVNRMVKSACPIVVLEQDISHTGIPCLRSLNPGGVERLLEHLRDKKHKDVACLNTQPVNNVIRERISYWELWKAATSRWI